MSKSKRATYWSAAVNTAILLAVTGGGVLLAAAIAGGQFTPVMGVAFCTGALVGALGFIWLIHRVWEDQS